MMRFCLALVLLLAATGSVGAQVTSQPKFNPFANPNNERFLNSSVGRWADQLGLELDTLRTVTSSAPLRPVAKSAIDRQARVSKDAVAALQRIVRRGGTRDQLRRAHETVETTLSELARMIRTDVQAAALLSQPLAKITYANSQLDATIDGGVPNPGGNLRQVAKLADALSDQGEELRGLIDDATGNNPNRQLDLAVRSFTRAARKMDRNLEDGGNLQQAQADFAAVGNSWTTVAALLGRAPNLPANIRVQAARVDGLYRKLGAVLSGNAGVVPGNPGWPGLIPPNPGIPGGPGFIPQKEAVIAVGASAGGGPRVRVYNDLRGEPIFDFFAYDPEFRGGVRVAVADLNGDGIPDLVTAPGPGMPALIRVFNGRDMSLLLEFNGIDPAKWQGGTNVAAADMGNTKRALIAVAPDAGGPPHVQIFDLTQGRLVDEYPCFTETLRGGLRIAYGDVNGDGLPDLIAAQGPCDHNPTVRAFSGKDRKIIAEFNAFEPQWRRGVWVAAADVTGNGRSEIIVGTDEGAPARVRLFEATQGRMLGELSPFPAAYRGGVRVSARDIDGDGVLDMICVPGNGLRNTPLRVFSGKTRQLLGEVATIPGFDGGAFVGSK